MGGRKDIETCPPQRALRFTNQGRKNITKPQGH